MSTHTPGPWRIDTLNNLVVSKDERHTIICKLGNLRNLQIAADASLIAAAPDMLEYCKMMASNGDTYARELVAKAAPSRDQKGEQGRTA